MLKFFKDNKAKKPKATSGGSTSSGGVGGNIRFILPTDPVAPAYNKGAVTLLYQHNRNWVPDARERLPIFGVAFLLIVGGGGFRQKRSPR